MFLNVYFIIDNLCSILEIITRPSEIRNKKRKRKVIVVKKASAGGGAERETDNSKKPRGSKVFVKRVKKIRDPRKASINNQNKSNFPTAAFFDEIRKQLVFKSSGYV